jgi:negative regulator of sigma E activity
MTEQINDQISAFIDDELSEEESALLVRRFERDAEARSQVVRYTLIGAAVRGEALPQHTALRRRVATALSGATQPAVAARAPARWPRHFTRPLLGVGIAATVAAAAIVGLRSINEARLAPGSATQAPAQARQWTEPPSYTVPQDVVGDRAVTPPIRLTNYLVHHGEYASRLSRTSVHSNVVGAAEVLPASVEAARPPE